ncbi:hypothetical protein BDZ45DRAFT_751745 [Acephala macrosclerotiorum]|nr:hypothetical protein BDZ45DRAFT_751745 [Acephala macrosclerotiorum]
MREVNAQRMRSEQRLGLVARGKGMLLDTQLPSEMREGGEILKWDRGELLESDVTELNRWEVARILKHIDATGVERTVCETKDSEKPTSSTKIPYQETQLSNTSQTSSLEFNLIKAPNGTVNTGPARPTPTPIKIGKSLSPPFLSPSIIVPEHISNTISLYCLNSSPAYPVGLPITGPTI